MASIFTYEPEPHRVASPWLRTPDTTGNGASGEAGKNRTATPEISVLSLQDDSPDGKRVTRLQAEPQEGPVEYKLHLLLRPRRKFRSTSTGIHISGSKHSRLGSPDMNRTVPEFALDTNPAPGTATPPTPHTQQTRQHRLEQLTTQLLWRLQQSSPHHTSSATNIILPSLPEALPELQAPQLPAKLLHGLEESQGALYEIGVCDDGTLVGLAEDEMLESLNNLRAMAACLGCTVEVLRKETVGDCEWLEDTLVGQTARQTRRHGKLVVAEALIKPVLLSKSPQPPGKSEQHVHGTGTSAGHTSTVDISDSGTEQLRVTLTGPTISGKSTLLGTLTTSTLDNGRGKSRLSMLKHRHEINSGITSSVTQELLGYRDVPTGGIEVVNYAAENVASWIDIHAAAAGNRLVFISDSAGHPRYRRTTLRGLVGWAPHWTLLCIPADDTEDTTERSGSTPASEQHLGTSVQDMDLSGAQLALCLRLELPLVVIITKLDLASRSGLRESLTKVLDALKAAGKKPAIIPNKPGTVAEEDLQFVNADVLDSAYNAAVPLLNSVRDTVPIVLTSAVDGTGIANLHALLHELPMPDTPRDDEAAGLLTTFDIEDVYSKPAEVDGVIVSGRLRLGQVTVGDSMLIGPFSGHDHHGDSEDSDDRPPRRPAAYLPTSRSFPGALRDSHFTSPHYQLPNQEWRRVKVTSARNLRLPVHSLHTDQVGTVAIVLDEANATPSPLHRVRKGMVLAAVQPPSTRNFTARFKREDLETLAVGTQVVVYISSVRASARVISARAPDPPGASLSERYQSTDEEPFNFDGDSLENNFDGQGSRVAGVITDPELLVTFGFEGAKEFVIIGDRILVMPGGGPGLYDGKARGERGMAGLDGFVGHITEVRG